MKSIVRKAVFADREAIHAAHMRSIREVCVKDHGIEEIKGWGYRALGDRWIEGIEKGLVWVVDHNNEILGVASIEICDEEKTAHIRSLYLTPEIIGKGFGRDLLEIMILHAKKSLIQVITLDSTISAHEFYKKMGFYDCGAVRKRPIGGFPVTSYPMKIELSV